MLIANDTLPEIGTENWYRFLARLTCNLVPNFSGTSAGNEYDMLYFRAGLWYLFPGTVFMVSAPISI